MIQARASACSLSLILLGAATAAADPAGTAPKSLQMRARSQGRGNGKQVAQVPAGSTPAASDPPAGAGDAAAAPAAPEPSAAPPPAEAAATAAVPDPSSSLSEDAFAKLAEQASKEEVIVVTGSTIGRRIVTQPAPLTTLDRDTLYASGRNTLGDVLQGQLPSETLGANSQSNTDGSTRIDIRGLGQARTLTLVNGRRFVPGGTGGNVGVDLNAIPLAIVERVEVLKDGASAVYGSEAIGGVVNVITRSDFEGTEASLYTGGTSRGDGFTYDASMVTGYNTENKKANITFAAGLQKQDPVLAGDRSYASVDKAYDYPSNTVSPNGSTVASAGRINTKTIDLNGDGKPDAVTLCGANVQFCASNGMGGFRPFISPDDLYNPAPPAYLYVPSQRYNLYSTGSYKIVPSTQAFYEASYMNRRSDSETAPEAFTGTIPISKDSLYNPIGGTVLGYQRRLDEFGPKVSSYSMDTFRVVGGVKGSVPHDVPVFDNFKWELSYNYGRNDAETKTTGALIKSRLAAAIGPSFINAKGVPTCGTPAAPIAGCIPINLLGGAGSIDPAAVSYLSFTGIRSGYNEQQVALAQTHGRLVELPNNGDISIALGGDYRKESGAIIPDPLSATGDSTSGTVVPSQGAYHVVEGFGEISIVPISGKQFAEWVELNAAARVFHYDTFGNGVTWKTGAMFRTVNGIGFRGTWATSFRAPAITEAFAGTSDAFPVAVDPCDTKPKGTTIALDPGVAAQCMAQGVPNTAAFGTTTTHTVTIGNPKLKPETAKILTAGITFEPPQIRGLSLSADYWRNDISAAIQSMPASIVLANCYTRHIQSYCDQIHRDPSLGFAIEHIDTPWSNVGGASGDGIDTALTYDHSFSSIGRVREQFEAQYLFTADLDSGGGEPLHLAGNSDFGMRPRFRSNFISTWQHPGGAGGGFIVRYVGQFHECQANNCSGGAPSRTVPQWYKLDLFGSYAVKSGMGTTTLTVGVNNVLDRTPGALYNSAIDSDSTVYDYLGRFIYARMSQTF